MLPLRLAPAAALLASAIWSVAPLQAGQDSEEAEATVARPNVVFILADDLGYGDLRSYNEASRIPTPRLDRLAAEGLRFTDAHSPSAVCTPTRYGILTGRYAWRTALQRNVLWEWDPPLLEEERTTLAELARTAGYRTACIGKWHLGWNWPLNDGRTLRDLVPLPALRLPMELRSTFARMVDLDAAIPGGPLDHGFEHFFGDDVPHFPPYAFVEDDRLTERPTSTLPPTMFGTPGPMVPGWDLSVVLPTLARRAAVWIEQQEEPFFLYLSLTAPHTPIAPSPHFAGKSGAGPYGDFVHEVDWVAGVVLDALERKGIAKETLVVFASDNGSPGRDGEHMMSGEVNSVRRLQHDPSGGWRGIKGDIHEGGHRIPLIVRWPGQVEAGRTSDVMLSLTDLYRTLASAMEAEVPAGNGEDSFDALPLWLDESPQPPRDHLVMQSFEGVLAIREGPWKLIFSRNHGGFSPDPFVAEGPPGQLYNLQDDPGETRNRFESEPARVKQLEARIRDLIQAGSSRPR